MCVCVQSVLLLILFPSFTNSLINFTHFFTISCHNAAYLFFLTFKFIILLR